MKSNRFSIGKHRRSFTLVELLVAIAVLSLMLVALAAAMGGVTSIWRAGLVSVDNFNKARVVMNLLDRDVQMMVLRRDLAAFVDNNGNQACAFYANVPAYQGTASSDPRTVSLVQYALTNSASSSVLQRLSYGLSFANSATSGIGQANGYSYNKLPVAGWVSTTGSPASTALSQLTPGGNTSLQTEGLYSGIIQFQMQFVNGYGTNCPAFSYNFTQPSLASNSRAVVVSMVVLSNPAYTLASKTGNVLTIAGYFSTNALTTPTTYSQVWNNYLTTNAAGSGFYAQPETVRRGVQVFERHIPLPITTPSS